MDSFPDDFTHAAFVAMTLHQDDGPLEDDADEAEELRQRRMLADVRQQIAQGAFIACSKGLHHYIMVMPIALSMAKRRVLAVELLARFPGNVECMWSPSACVFQPLSGAIACTKYKISF